MKVQTSKFRFVPHLICEKVPCPTDAPSLGQLTAKAFSGLSGSLCGRCLSNIFGGRCKFIRDSTDFTEDWTQWNTISWAISETRYRTGAHTLKTTGLTAKNAISPLYIWFETLWRSRKPVPAADFTSNLEIDFNQYIIERMLPSAISEVKRVTWLHRIRWHWKIGSSHKWITVQRFLRQINPSRSWTSITSQNDDAGKRLHAWAIRHAFFGCKRTGECAGLDSRQRHPPQKCNCRFILNSVAHSVTLHSNSFHPTPSLTHSTSLNIPLLCVPLCILLHLTFCHCFLSFFHLPLGFRLSSLATYISQSCQKPVGPSNQNKACDLQFLLVKTKGLWVCGTQILGHTNIFSIKKHHQCGQEILLTP